MLNDFTKSVIWFKFFTTEPVAFAHEEWEVTDVLVSLELVTLEKLVSTQVHKLVELFVEASPVGFFAFFKGDTVLNTKANKVDSSK